MKAYSYRFYDCPDPIRNAFDCAKQVHELAKTPVNGSSGAIWFRGQAKWKWDLVPSVGRRKDWPKKVSDANESDRPKLLLDHERVLLQRFERDGYPFLKEMLTDWEAIILGQHYGLPTRLLDWTSDVFVALFFAAVEELRSDGAIFAYRPRADSTHHVSIFEGQNPRKPAVPDPFTLNGVKIVFPIMLADRLVAQSGGLTIQDPLKCLMCRARPNKFDKSELDIAALMRWRLPRKNKPKILDQLHRFGVNRRRLFPGLDTVARTLAWQEQFRKHPGGYR